MSLTMISTNKQIPSLIWAQVLRIKIHLVWTSIKGLASTFFTNETILLIFEFNIK